MPLKENIKSVLKRTTLYERYYPKFGRPCHNGDRLHEYWLLGEIEHFISNNRNLNSELFPGEYGKLINKILEIAKIKSEVPEDKWDEITKDFESKIKTVSCHMLSSLQWKDLCFLACRFGLHRAGYEFRLKAIEYLYDKGTRNKDINELCELFSAAMELGDFETADYLINDKLCRGGKGFLKCIKYAQDFYSLFCSYDSRMKMARGHYTKDDEAFADYLNGKRIALVGPAQPKVQLGPEIDTYDIIVRMAYQGGEHLSKEFAGSRTDISYYCAWRGLELLRMPEKDFIYDLDYIVQKDPQCKLNLKDVNERTAYSFIEQTFTGYYNMIPFAMLDLLMFDAKEIKIFNTNFHLSDDSYAKGFSAVFDHAALHDRDLILNAITVHNQITQISLIRNLCKCGLCKADDECKRILSMPNEEIMDEYSRYHPYTWGVKSCAAYVTDRCQG